MKRSRILSIAALALALTPLAACGDSRSEEQKLIDANLKLEQMSFRSAVIELRNVLRANPQSLQARMALARALEQLQDFDAAEKELERAVELGASPDDTLPVLAQIYLGRTAFAQMLAEIDPAQVSSPATRSELEALRGKAMLAMGSKAEAATLFDQVLAAGASTEAQRVALLGKATIASDQADFTLAEKLARQSLEIAPDSAESFLRVGQLLLVQNKQAEANSFLSDANTTKLRMVPMDRFRLLGERAQAAMAVGDLDAANAAAQAMSKINSDHPMSGYLRGQVAYQREDYDTALEDLQAVAAKYPGFIPVQALLGAVSLRRGEYEQAEVFLSTAIAAQPNNAGVRQLLAETRMRMSRPEAAAATLRDGLRNDQGNSMLLTMLGRATAQTDGGDTGVQYLLQALEADPSNVQAKISLAAGYVASGDRDKAIELIESLPEDAIDPKRKQILLVVSRYDENDPSAARAKLDELLAATPDDPSVLALAGGFALSTGDLDSARRRYEQVLTIEPDNRSAQLAILRVDEQQNDLSRSRQLFTQLVERNPSDYMANLVLAKIAESDGDHQRAIALVTRANVIDPTQLLPNLTLVSEAMRVRNLDEAESYARQALSHHSQSAQANGALGFVFLERRNFDEALGFLKKAAGLSPENFFYHYKLAQAQVGAGQLAQARASFRESFRLNSSHLASLRSLAILEVRAGEGKRADELLRFAKDNYGAGPRLDELTGDIRSAQGQHAEAMLAFNTAFETSPSWPLASKIYNERRELGSPDATLPLRNWLDGNPKHVPARLLLAQHYQRAKNDVKAIEQYEMLIVEKPDSAYALNNLAWLYFSQDGAQNRQRALEIAERAFKLAPLNADIADTFGWIQFNSGQAQAGLETLRRALSGTSARRKPDIAYHLAAVLHETGARDEARETLIQALASTRPFQSRAEAQQLLESL
ncbi:MAG: XrtA/PEP-CTERM system TPR-repeat protein PrsT [Gammaproteobacteria bacterium]